MQKIYLIREQKVMLDRDLAELYGVETRYLNKAVKRNILSFPADFMFQLSETEYHDLIFQFGTSSSELKSWGGLRKNPFVFSESGVAMLSGVSGPKQLRCSSNILRLSNWKSQGKKSDLR